MKFVELPFTAYPGGGREKLKQRPDSILVTQTGRSSSELRA